jgi:Flp pilus assembly pilin Flp
MIRQFQKLVRDEQGGTAAEFAMVLPILIIFLLGIIDVGRLMWDWNQAEKATQMGIRYAVVTDMVPSDLEDYSFAIDGGVLQGNLIDDKVFGGVSCTGTASTANCTCIDSSACDTAYLSTSNYEAFNEIVNRINDFKPDVAAENVVIEYGYSGLGFAGDPNGPDVAPLVTVRLRNLDFQPLLTQIFGATIPLPEFSAALTLEDGVGTFSN